MDGIANDVVMPCSAMSLWPESVRLGLCFALIGWLYIPVSVNAAESMLLDGKGEWALDAKSDTSGSGISAKTAPQAKETATGSGSGTRTLGGLLVLLGCIGGALLIVKRRNDGQADKANLKNMELIERMPLGLRRELLMVRVHDRLLVMASIDRELKLIASLKKPEDENDSEQVEELEHSALSEFFKNYKPVGATAAPVASRIEFKESLREAESRARATDWPGISVSA